MSLGLFEKTSHKIYFLFYTVFKKHPVQRIEVSFIGVIFTYVWVSLVAQMVRHLPTMWETQVQSLGREDPLEKEMATHSSTLACRIPWTEEPGRLQFIGLRRVSND